MGKSIDAVLELQQRDKMMMELGAIEKACKDVADAMGKKFVPLEESAFDSACSLLNTALLCVNAAAKEFDSWLEAEECACQIPMYEP